MSRSIDLNLTRVVPDRLFGQGPYSLAY